MDVWAWMAALEKELRAVFGQRMLFLGLQGSQARGEATEDSDIDVVLILDRIEMDDLRAYDGVLARMPEREKACGFVAGWAELATWEPSDLFGLVYDTTPLVGSLDALRARIGAEDVRRAVWTGACNLYHGAVHNAMHGRSKAGLAGLYKSAAFALRAKVFAETGEYVSRQAELRERLSGDERRALDDAAALRSGAEGDFDALTERLIALASDLIAQYGGGRA